MTALSTEKKKQQTVESTFGKKPPSQSQLQSQLQQGLQILDNDTLGLEMDEHDYLHNNHNNNNNSEYDNIDGLLMDGLEQTKSKVLIIITGGTFIMAPTPQGLQVQPGFLERKMKSDADFKHASLPKYEIKEWEKPIDSSQMSPELWIKLAQHIQSEYDNYDGFIILHGTDTMAYTASALSFFLKNLSKPVVITGAQIPISEVFNDAKNNLIGALCVAGKLEICEVCILFNNKLFRGNRSSKIDPWHQHAFDSPNFPPLALFGIDLEIEEHLFLPAPVKPLKVQSDVFKNIMVIWLTPVFNYNMLKALYCQHAKKYHRKSKSNDIDNRDGYHIDNSASNDNEKDKSKENEQSNATANSNTNTNTNANTNANANANAHSNTNENEKELKTNNDCEEKALVLVFYGVGFGKMRERFFKCLRTLQSKCHTEIALVSHCERGHVDTGLYSFKSVFAKLNAIYCADMTVEATVTKMAYLMGKGYRGQNLKALMQRNLRGELTPLEEVAKKVISIKAHEGHGLLSEAFINDQ